MKHIGTVLEITTLGDDSKQMVIQMDAGKYELFFSDLKGWNKSLKVGHRVQVFYRSGIMGTWSYRVVRTKDQRPALKLISA